MKSFHVFLHWLFFIVAALLAPAMAAFASAVLYFQLYGARAEPVFVLQLYAGFFVVLNLLRALAYAAPRRRGAVAFVALVAAAAGLGLLLAARATFPQWPPAPLLRDLLFVGGAAFIAMVAARIAAFLT